MAKRRKQIIKDNSFNEFILYNGPDGNIKFEVFLSDENIWLTQKRIAELFGVDRTVVTKHLRNIFETKELNETSVCANFAHTAEDGKIYQIKFGHYRQNCGASWRFKFTGIRLHKNP